MKTIHQIINHLQQSLPDNSQANDYLTCAVHQLSLDSRQMAQGDGFIALQGGLQHGLDYLQTALIKQPGLVISDRCLNQNEQSLIDAYNSSSALFCYILVVEDLLANLAALAHWFYEQPSQRIKVVGITGTNGKTSTAFYTAQLLEGLGQKTALIGTLGNGLFSNLQSTLNTTPDVVSVHRLLAEFIKLGAQWVLMEVSSHALELGRIKCVEFEAVALTQITRDHMDFHGTVELYQAAKQKLFTDYRSKRQILNMNDATGQSLASSRQVNAVFRYGRLDSSAQISEVMEEAIRHSELLCDQLQLQTNGMVFNLRYQDEMFGIQVPLLGTFNAENVLCACAIILSNDALQAGILEIRPLLKKLQSVLGRMQQISQSPSVIVDFAHTPDALEQVLLAVKQHLGGDDTGMQTTRPGKLWVVFGCGGDRDQGKRPLMARVAESIADHVMVTDDNPRFENSQQITQQILRGFKQANAVLQQADRKLAIEQVLGLAQPDDIVVIAGKGHELYQDIEGQKTPFSDQQVVLDYLKSARSLEPSQGALFE